jgi:hypothetical protein
MRVDSPGRGVVLVVESDVTRLVTQGYLVVQA